MGSDGGEALVHLEDGEEDGEGDEGDEEADAEGEGEFEEHDAAGGTALPGVLEAVGGGVEKSGKVARGFAGSHP